MNEGYTMGTLSRRSALKAGALATAAASAGVTTGCSHAVRRNPEHTRGHTIAFGDQYHQRMTGIIEKVVATEMGKIGDISSRMAESLKKGGNVWMHAQAGHMGYTEFMEEHKGNPGILRSSTTWGGSDYDKMRPGDVLMTNYVTEDVRAARDNGVHVVGVPVNYVDNKDAPRGYASPSVNDWFLDDVSSEILQSYIPYYQGIVDCPEIPEMQICPSAANSLCSLYWALQAEVANKYKNSGARTLDYAPRYFDTILERVSTAYDTQRDAIFSAAADVAKRIGNGGNYHVTSEHRGVQSESNGVAMGPMMTNAFRDDMSGADVHLLATIEPDAASIVAEAEKAKGMGMYVVGIAPGNSTALKRQCDLFIDNLSPEGGGLFAIDGYSDKVSTTGGVLNNWLMWNFTAQFVDEMVLRGWIPWFYMGYYRVGGREYSEGVKPFFQAQGF